MGEKAPALVHLEVPCDRSAPLHVREALQGLEPMGWVLGDAMLVASELVTNAVLYSGCAEEDLLEVEVDRAGDHLLVAVRDPGRSGGVAKLVAGEAREFGGMGLWVVDQVAHRWGSDRLDGYRVWAELPLSREG